MCSAGFPGGTTPPTHDLESPILHWVSEHNSLASDAKVVQGSGLLSGLDCICAATSDAADGSAVTQTVVYGRSPPGGPSRPFAHELAHFESAKLSLHAHSGPATVDTDTQETRTSFTKGIDAGRVQHR